MQTCHILYRQNFIVLSLRFLCEAQNFSATPRISQEPHVWSTSGLLWWIPLGCKSCMAWLPYCVSAGHGAWRVPNMGYFGRPPKHFTSITAQPLYRLGLFIFIGHFRLTWYTARHSTDNSCLWVIFGVLQHVRTCTPRFYISRTAEPIALIFGM